MRFTRSAGTLVHPTSFATKYGIGDLGSSARTFIDFLVNSKQAIWQVLPLGPTGYGNSPYASYSAFAGNIYLISPDTLLDKGLITAEQAKKAEMPISTEVNYQEVFKRKRSLLEEASKNFYANRSSSQEQKFEDFKKQNEYWLHDFVLFMTALEINNGTPWNRWENELSRRTSKGIKKLKDKHADRISFHYWTQFEFFNEWYDIKKYATENKIRIIGDIPIFVDHNSADVWSHPQYFAVDESGDRQLVAGVPPDYFSETGQLWGNPQYKWKSLENDNYSWWIQRFEQMFSMYHAIRVDHFRGFDAYWEVKADEKTAINGRWVKGPGSKLFDTIKEELGELPIIAEDLGVITPEVVELRERYNFPGMKILQFAFSGSYANSFLPHNYSPNCVTYTGTHDNDTSLGWFQQAPEDEKHKAREYTKSDGEEINWELIRLGLLSVADQAVVPLQDFMNLDSPHRMNLPGTATGNWDWRYTPDMLENVDTDRIKHLITMANRDIRSNNEDANLTSIETEEAGY